MLTVSRRHNSSAYPQSLNGTAALFFTELLLETREKSLIVLSTRGSPFLRSTCFNGRSTGRQFNLLAWWTLHSLECSLFAHFPIVRKPTRNKYESFGGDTSGISTSRRRKQHKTVRKGKKKEHQQKQKKNGRWKPQTSLPVFYIVPIFFSIKNIKRGQRNKQRSHLKDEGAARLTNTSRFHRVPLIEKLGESCVNTGCQRREN